MADTVADVVRRDNLLWLQMLDRPDTWASDHEKSLRQYFPHGDGLFVDVGAHAGSHAVYVAGTGRGVLAFEPNPINNQVLKVNLALNNLSGLCKVYCVALSSESRTSRITNWGGASMLKPDGEFECEVVTLDSIIGDQHSIAMIKIDVEGAEADVLVGARETLAKYRPKLLIESHHNRGDFGDGLRASVIHELDRAGYLYSEVALEEDPQYRYFVAAPGESL